MQTVLLRGTFFSSVNREMAQLVVETIACLVFEQENALLLSSTVVWGHILHSYGWQSLLFRSLALQRVLSSIGESSPLNGSAWFLKLCVIPLLPRVLRLCATCTQLVTVFSGDLRIARFYPPCFLYRRGWVMQALACRNNALCLFAICIVCMSNQDNLENKRLPRNRRGNLTCRGSQNVLFLKCYALMYVWLIHYPFRCNSHCLVTDRWWDLFYADTNKNRILITSWFDVSGVRDMLIVSNHGYLHTIKCIRTHLLWCYYTSLPLSAISLSDCSTLSRIQGSKKGDFFQFWTLILIEAQKFCSQW